MLPRGTGAIHAGAGNALGAVTATTAGTDESQPKERCRKAKSSRHVERMVAPFGPWRNLQTSTNSLGVVGRQLSRSVGSYLGTSGVHFDGIADPSVPRSPSVIPPLASPCTPPLLT
jgi:hypothetical protein